MANINWRVDNNAGAALTILAMANAASFWNSNLPSVYEIPSKLNDSDISLEAIRLGVAKSLLEASLLGVGATLITKSWWPIVGTVSYVGISYLFLLYATNHYSQIDEA